jgi:hypothetical protein
VGYYNALAIENAGIIRAKKEARMRRNMFKSSIIAAVAGMIFLVGTALSVYAHDPAGTQGSDESHIHIKGKITTPEGKGIPGLGVYAFTPPNTYAAQGFPPECGLNFKNNPGLTDSAGQYELLIFIDAKIPSCRNAFDSITLDKTKLRILNQNGSQPPYDFKIK